MFQELLHAKVFQEYAEKIQFPSTPENLYDPIRYMLSLSGKRIRPLLVSMGAALFNVDKVALALPASTAIEYFHNFSLIHDDIMDKAPLRRGKVTVHQKWNDSVAILSGDALLVKAYEELAKCPVEQIAPLLRLFNKTALEVCEGQQYDMDFEERHDVITAEYIDMIRLKTSVLLGCALQMGAIIADANEEDQRLLYAFGVNLGIAFQLQDDLLDVYGDPKTFGKQVGGDILSNKKTILFIKLKEVISAEDTKTLDYLLATDVNNEPDKVNKMKALYARYAIERAGIDLKEQYTATAYEKLRRIAISEDRKQALFSLADALMNREQ